jgi:hypothetical protein
MSAASALALPTRADSRTALLFTLACRADIETAKRVQLGLLVFPFLVFALLLRVSEAGSSSYAQPKPHGGETTQDITAWRDREQGLPQAFYSMLVHGFPSRSGVNGARHGTATRRWLPAGLEIVWIMSVAYVFRAALAQGCDDARPHHSVESLQAGRQEAPPVCGQ